MRIQWNKVTWYSKAIALALFVALPFAAFFWGVQYGALVATIDIPPVQINATTAAATSAFSPYYRNIAEWQTDTRDDAGFAISYPIDFPIDDNYSVAPSTDWQLNANGTPGIKVLALTIPKVFEPQTNFSDATLTVGRSSNALAVTDCLQIPENAGITSSSTVMINGVPFLVLNSNSAGAGNLYQTTGYYALHAGQCYSIEYTIHSSQIANYPPSYNLQPFNEATLADVLNRIVGTFKFE